MCRAAAVISYFHCEDTGAPANVYFSFSNKPDVKGWSGGKKCPSETGGNPDELFWWCPINAIKATQVEKDGKKTNEWQVDTQAVTTDNPKKFEPAGKVKVLKGVEEWAAVKEFTVGGVTAKGTAKGYGSIYPCYPENTDNQCAYRKAKKCVNEHSEHDINADGLKIYQQPKAVAADGCQKSCDWTKKASCETFKGCDANQVLDKTKTCAAVACQDSDKAICCLPTCKGSAFTTDNAKCGATKSKTEQHGRGIGHEIYTEAYDASKADTACKGTECTALECCTSKAAPKGQPARTTPASRRPLWAHSALLRVLMRRSCTPARASQPSATSTAPGKPQRCGFSSRTDRRVRTARTS